MVKISITDEFKKQPEDLTESQLKKATGLAKILTSLRQVSYITVELLVMVYIFINVFQMIAFPLDVILIAVGVLYALFKLRDFIRGDN